MDSSISKQLRPQDSIRQFKSTKDGPTGQAAVTTKGAEGGLRSPPRPKNSPPRPKRTMRRRDSAVKLARSFELEQLRLQIEELRVENKNLKSSFSSQQSVLASRDQEMAAKLMAKDQEILSKRQELSAREAAVEAHKATVTAKEATIHGLTRQLEHLQDYLAVKNEPHLLMPRAQLTWKRCTDLPSAMVFGQAVAVGKTVYFGSGTVTTSEAPSDSPNYQIFQYDSTQDSWSPVAGCPVVGFGMVEFLGRLMLVGGAYESTDEDSGSSLTLTSDVHTLEEETAEWEKSIPAMPTARLLPTVLSYDSSIVACGGIILDAAHDSCVNTVEVFSNQTLQWYQAEALPLACIGMSSTIIQDDCYLLGGFTDTDFDHPTAVVLSVNLPDLIHDALPKQGLVNGSVDQSASQVWYSYPEAPRYASTAANIGKCLITLGGSDERLEHKSGALHVYSPLTESWLRIEDTPVPCFACAVVKLPLGDILMMGGMGHDEDDALRTVYRGCIAVD